MDDRVLAEELIGLIVERAKLQNKSRGVIDWAYRGKSYKITVAGYENFGESAFKLLSERPKRNAPNAGLHPTADLAEVERYGLPSALGLVAAGEAVNR